MQRRKRWTWRRWAPAWTYHLAGRWAFGVRIQEAERIPHGLNWKAILGAVFLYLRIGPWVKRVRVPLPGGGGLAPELTDYRGLTCPWLSRTAGRPVPRPDLWRTGVLTQRLTALTVEIQTAFEPLTVAARQAVDAMNAFGRAVSVALDGRLTAAGKDRLFR